MAKRSGKQASGDPSAAGSKDQSPGFEDAMDEVESIIEAIESGSLGLDESIDAYERGVKLLGRCRQTLSAAEQRVEDLTAAVRALEQGEAPGGGESRRGASGADEAGA